MEAELVFHIHLLCTHAMIGLIWFVQVVHYPMFDSVGENNSLTIKLGTCALQPT